MPQTPIYHRIAGTHSNVNTTEETVLQFPTYDGVNYRSERWLLHLFRYKVTGGSAANYNPSIGEETGYAIGDVTMAADYGSSVVGTYRNELTIGDGVPCKTDANGRLYFKPGFDAGADNDGEYVIEFRKAAG